MKVAAFIVTFIVGSLFAAASNAFSEPNSQPIDPVVPPPASSPKGSSPAPQLWLNCVDAALDPKLRAERLKEIARLRRKVEKLSREVKKKNTLKRDIEILDETIRTQNELKELEQVSNSSYTKSLYREICYQ